MGIRLFAGAALALGLFTVGCAGSKSEVKPTPTPAAATPTGSSDAAAADKSRVADGRPSLDPIYFDFDQAIIHPNDGTTLEAIGRYLIAGADRAITVSGHCDERGTVEYNIALGDRRAAVARDFLVRLGVDASRIRTISYGELKPADRGHDEAAWAKNRRDEFQLEQKQRAQANP